MPKTKTRRRSFTVTLDLPPGLTVKDAQAYIEEAVATWHGQEDPESPVFHLDGDSVRVKVVPQPK